MEMNENITITNKEKIEKALKLVAISFPYLYPMLEVLQFYENEKVNTICISKTGSLIYNPYFVLELSLNDLKFILAHEVFHLVYQTHQRLDKCSNKSFMNIAHDMIINEMLSKELNCKIPAGGLQWSGAENLSAETIVKWLEKESKNHNFKSWESPIKMLTKKSDPKLLAEKLTELGLADDNMNDELDCINEISESILLPDEFEDIAKQEVKRIENIVEKVLLNKVIEDKKNQDTIKSEFYSMTIEAIKYMYKQPWELALQQWMEAVAPGPRTYSRPSRRDSGRTDIVLPGRKREGWILHIILDTSGSMENELKFVLGTIATFCDNVNVNEIHIVQCDTEITSDEYISPEDLMNYEIKGLGGSDMTPAMLHLEDDIEVESVIIITDGYIEYPKRPMLYNVLWVITDEDNIFNPPYGKVLKIIK